MDLETVRLANQQAYRDSLYRTAKYLCGNKDINERTHGECIRALSNSTKNKLIVMPRGAFKTSLAVVSFSIWNIIRNPNIRILIDSELASLSFRTLGEIKGHIKGEAFQSVFPGVKLTLDNQASMTVSTRTVVKKEPTITASGIGAGKTGGHYDLIIADDLNSPLNSLKPEVAQGVIDHYRYYTSLLDPGCTKVIIGTRYSELDLIAFILRNEVEFESGTGQHDSSLGISRMA